tara:strand:- start:2194 stop:3198 length:1005 start_codon:yes stop_codon:yes gene_type:complete
MILLKDQEKITEAEHEVAKVQWEKAHKFYQEKESSNFLCNYGSIWEPKAKEIANLFKEPPSIERLNQLRFSTGCFTGYSIPNFSHRNVPTICDLVDEEEFDNNYKNNFAKNYGMIKKLMPLVRGTLPKQHDVIFPAKFGEVGETLNDKIVNVDTMNYQFLFEKLYEIKMFNWLKKPGATVVEIGGGYGAMAYLFKKVLPHINYIIVDIPEALYFSMMYLGIVSKEVFEFVPNYLIETLSSKKIDLIININSIAELPKEHVDFYLPLLSKMAGRHGVFIECNQDLPFEKEKSDCCLKSSLAFKRHFNFSRNLDNLIWKGKLNIKYNTVSVLDGFV